MIIAALSFATFCSDLGIPAVWAYAQDVGGPYTASIMGWANMFGNLGAAIAPNIYAKILGETPGVKEWNMLFFTCGMMFVMAGICSLALDSTKAIRAGENRG
jgi:nitrate/nitrite transporter NarK